MLRNCSGRCGPIRRLRSSSSATPTTGGLSYNLDLSQRRAAGVYVWLVERGVDSGRLRSEVAASSSRSPTTRATPGGRSTGASR